MLVYIHKPHLRILLENARKIIYYFKAVKKIRKNLTVILFFLCKLYFMVIKVFMKESFFYRSISANNE